LQVSFQPHLLAIAFENNAQTLANIRTNSFYTLNFLSQKEASMRLAAKFAQPYLASKIGGPRVRGVHHKLEEIEYKLTRNGAPILRQAMAWLECRAADFILTGDHTVVVGEILDGSLVRAEEPLTSTFTGWTYSG
jgi:flavin reductase (DIM6/NTAB) family NADH-FMN oxidoreductase RutF